MLEKILYSKEQIEGAVTKIANQINEDYVNDEVVFISILNGSFIFAADLVRGVNIPCDVEFMQVSTYGKSTESSGVFRVKKDITCDIENKHVIIIEDIIDSGFTLYNLVEYMKSHNPASVKIATLIDKPSKRVRDIDVDYVGFVLNEDEFIVGYGLDYAGKYRNLPYVGVLNN